jgi:hypothetical protein
VLSPTRTTRTVALVTVLAFGLSACGAGRKPSPPTAPPKTATTPKTVKSPLDAYLLREGEGGFAVFSVAVVQPTIASWVKVSRSTAADGRRVHGEGFRGALEQATATSTGGTGLDFVLELSSAAAARREQAVELKEDVAEQGHYGVTRFTVPGVPGSQGIAATGGKRGSAANVLFTEGRCLLLVGNDEVDAKYRQYVVAGTLALYRRTVASPGACMPVGPAEV